VCFLAFLLLGCCVREFSMGSSAKAKAEAKAEAEAAKLAAKAAAREENRAAFSRTAAESAAARCTAGETSSPPAARSTALESEAPREEMVSSASFSRMRPVSRRSSSRSRAQRATGVGCSSPLRPAARGAAVTTPTTSKYGSAKTASKDGNAKRPLPISRIVESVTVGSRNASCALPLLCRRPIRVFVVVFVFVDSDQIIKRFKVINVELPLEVVELVLYGTRKKAVLAELIGAAMAVLRLNPYAFSARDVGNVTRDREAAFKIGNVALVTHDPRVDEFIRTPLRLNDCDVERFAELRSGKANTGCGTHRVDKVLKEAM
jgi:hypothetical protein